MSEYGDTHEERVRELIATGKSIRYTGRPIVTMICEALERDEDARPEVFPASSEED